MKEYRVTNFSLSQKQRNNFNFAYRESNSALPVTKKFLTSYCPMKFLKSELKSKNCQNSVMPASFTRFTACNTVKLPSKVSSTVFDVQTFILKGNNYYENRDHFGKPKTK